MAAPPHFFFSLVSSGAPRVSPVLFHLCTGVVPIRSQAPKALLGLAAHRLPASAGHFRGHRIIFRASWPCLAVAHWVPIAMETGLAWQRAPGWCVGSSCRFPAAPGLEESNRLEGEEPNAAGDQGLCWQGLQGPALTPVGRKPAEMQRHGPRHCLMWPLVPT